MQTYYRSPYVKTKIMVECVKNKVLVTNKELMVPARKNGYAIGAFNVQNLESVKVTVEAATEEISTIPVDNAQRD